MYITHPNTGTTSGTFEIINKTVDVRIEVCQE